MPLQIRRLLRVVGALTFVGAVASPALASTITFASITDYDNNTSQSTGVFRDVLNGALINSGLDLGGTGNTALNFSGTDTNAATQGRITLYDVDPSTATPTLFTGNLTASADILISTFNNGKGGGIVTLFNAGTGSTGLALFISNAGNTDNNNIRLVQQTGIATTNLATVNLSGGIVQDLWYHLTLSLVFSGSNFTITGQVFGHAVGTDPNSALGSQIGTTLIYNGVLGSGLASPYEIGLVARGTSAVVDTSITNFSFTGTNNAIPPVPEPGTLFLMATGLLVLARHARRRRSI